MTIALIGGAGFIGSRLANRLSKAEVSFIILDIKKSQAFPELSRYCNILSIDELREHLVGVTTIINLAAEHKDNVSPVSLYYDVNVEGSKNICKVAEELGIKNIIFTSSVAVYGFVESETDETGTYNPFNHYGISKLQAEIEYNNWIGNDSNKKLVIIRPTVVFGENNRGNVYNLFRQIASGKFLMIGSGNNKKSMAYVENVSAFIEHAVNFQPGHHVINYIDKPDYTMNELTTIITRSLGKKESNIRIPYFIGLLGGYVFDLLSKIMRREFPVSSIRVKKFCARTQFSSKNIGRYDFIPPVSLEKGIADTVKNEFSKF
ncbi:NAD-dependent epimerase/dehydratase family protein [Mixta intestinalis]|uniref:N-acetyl-alpha-D-glucosaminyl-diphospho-ditrans, octacis-undecaprenol 4-epimerase n=1 Tax=Mixta intestinalis TaxID=1615494 RepID=A0A6P1PYA4_9GAMM|nr:NAD-dependent epimerase/dehydratase family protein [Mixta intestinalis]QHM71580.1 N-acetyl-alpha-D-glucosaminyl-diphospho-ditrans,octacis-undecaprenol 4-epimerase [Mixta intestinalis]